ncbi:MAG: 30S ribosomal protein S13 [Candidatus Freyarchaeota archaeon]|nr:30S ribosomal protein S13 [Candidatus Freyrarchaeum guaymaensis]
MSTESYKHIVRLAGTDLDGSYRAAYALRTIKGINARMANAVLVALGIDPNRRLGFLTDAEIKKIEDAVSNPPSVGIPSWMLNRQKDLETGKDLHLIGSQLALTVKNDIELMKRIRCWKGVRHALGLKVRGQRTKTTGRKGQTVGVRRKKR